LPSQSEHRLRRSMSILRHRYRKRPMAINKKEKTGHSSHRIRPQHLSRRSWRSRCFLRRLISRMFRGHSFIAEERIQMNSFLLGFIAAGAHQHTCIATRQLIWVSSPYCFLCRIACCRRWRMRSRVHRLCDDQRNSRDVARRHNGFYWFESNEHNINKATGCTSVLVTHLYNAAQ